MHQDIKQNLEIVFASVVYMFVLLCRIDFVMCFFFLVFFYVYFHFISIFLVHAMDTTPIVKTIQNNGNNRLFVSFSFVLFFLVFNVNF